MISLAVSKSVVRARVFGKTLFAALSASPQPLVWILDLEAAPDLRLHLRETQEGWEIGTTKPDGVFVPAAHFTSEAGAMASWRGVQRALLKTRGPRRSGWIIAGLVALCVFLLLLALAGAAQNLSNADRLGPIQSTAHGLSIQTQPGEPVSADQVLKPPSDTP